jgi:undecaprenyl diphosphate synthase
MGKKQIGSKVAPLQHLAIIMDGNGRWAKAKGLPRLKGHQEGAKRVIDVAKTCKALHIPYLSLFAFSTENWQRPLQEVNGLFRLLNEFLKMYLKTLHEDQVRLIISGQLDGIPEPSKTLLMDAMAATKHYQTYTLNICVNYGGQDELVRASKKAFAALERGDLKLNDLTPKTMTQFLDGPSLPPIDALIRTSGEMRLSNFMLYQAAYAELIFVDTLWPDFTPVKLKAALRRYETRQRRFGSL